jgi:hypothetical protein
MALMMLFKKRPKNTVVPPSGRIRKTVNVPAKKHGAPRMFFGEKKWIFLV